MTGNRGRLKFVDLAIIFAGGSSADHVGPTDLPLADARLDIRVNSTIWTHRFGRSFTHWWLTTDKPEGPKNGIWMRANGWTWEKTLSPRHSGNQGLLPYLADIENPWEKLAGAGLREFTRGPLSLIPTSGVQAVWYALLSGAKIIYGVGLDFYSHGVSYASPDFAEDPSFRRYRAGYGDRAHSLRSDLVAIGQALQRFPESELILSLDSNQVDLIAMKIDKLGFDSSRLSSLGVQ